MVSRYYSHHTAQTTHLCRDSFFTSSNVTEIGGSDWWNMSVSATSTHSTAATVPKNVRAVLARFE
jgi:hypothetical protein